MCFIKNNVHTIHKNIKTLEKNFRKRIEGTSGAFSTVIAKNNLSMKQFAVDEDNGMRYPKQIIRIDRDNNRKLYHPTQETNFFTRYLIQTYTNKGDLVLDNRVLEVQVLLRIGRKL